MKTKICLALGALLVTASLGWSAPSGPKVDPKPKPEVVAYNAGVDLLMQKEFAAAAEKFAEALAKRERFAEAHNNLAYALRKQGAAEFPDALNHYNRAIELDRKLPEAYMYRGVLHVAMGNQEAAKADHAQLERLKSPLADELRMVIESGSEKSPEQFFGVTDKL